MIPKSIFFSNLLYIPSGSVYLTFALFITKQWHSEESDWIGSRRIITQLYFQLLLIIVCVGMCVLISLFCSLLGTGNNWPTQFQSDSQIVLCQVRACVYSSVIDYRCTVELVLYSRQWKWAWTPLRKHDIFNTHKHTYYSYRQAQGDFTGIKLTCAGH